MYLFQALVFWAFLIFAQMFVFLFANGGMGFNILALSLQLVTSGSLSENMGQLLLIISVTLIVSATAVTFKRVRSPRLAQEQTI